VQRSFAAAGDAGLAELGAVFAQRVGELSRGRADGGLGNPLDLDGGVDLVGELGPGGTDVRVADAAATGR